MFGLLLPTLCGLLGQLYEGILCMYACLACSVISNILFLEHIVSKCLLVVGAKISDIGFYCIVSCLRSSKVHFTECFLGEFKIPILCVHFLKTLLLFPACFVFLVMCVPIIAPPPLMCCLLL